MTVLDIAKQRIRNQHIATQIFKKPEDIVKWLGAVQAQDYAGAKWAIGLRLQNSTDAAIDKAMADGSIVRTHVLRPTWHFVSPTDVRWMIELTAPRINTFSASMFRKLQLDSAVFKQSNDALAKALEGSKQLNRTEVLAALNNAGVATDDLRFIHLLMRAELDKVICSGGRQGKQFTYALFDDRVPDNSFSKDEALAELARRYFTSRGPATLPDFTWWSGLTATDTKAALEMVKSELTKTIIEGAEYWSAENNAIINGKAPIAHLLPAFDEFAVAYKDRTATVNAKYLTQARHVIFDSSIVVDNQVVGTWKRTINKKRADITLNPFGKLNKTQTKAIEGAMDRYRKFISPKK
ncbi:MAG TPA: winged helix DNA-binding domain-containing protein [Mucilaginibacter sp.]|jgi:hypothetical protein